MRETHLQYLLAAALVVVAGYGVYTAAPQPAEKLPASAATPTGTPVPATTQPPEQLAPGLTWNGVTDPRALSSAHTNRLQNTSFVVVTVGSAWNENQSFVRNAYASSRVGHGGSPVYFVRNTSGTPPDASALARDVVLWHNDTHSFTRYVDQNGTVTYHQTTPAQDLLRGQPESGRFITSLFSSANTTVVERIEREEGTFYRVVSTSQSKSEVVVNRQRSNYSFSTLVDSSGVVHRYHVSYDVHEESSTLHISHTWRLSNLGSTTVEQPAWVDEARNATASRR